MQPNVENLARNTLVFLSRVDLKGTEAAPFQESVAWIQSFITPVSQEKPESTPKGKKEGVE